MKIASSHISINTNFRSIYHFLTGEKIDLHFDADGIVEPRETQNEIIDLTKQLITIYPNPFDNLLKIESNVENSTYEIYNINGVRITNGQVNITKEIDTSNWTRGIYIIKILDSEDKELKIEKLIK